MAGKHEVDSDSLGLPLLVYSFSFEQLPGGPEGMLMHLVEGWCIRGTTDSPPRGPRPGPSLVPERPWPW